MFVGPWRCTLLHRNWPLSLCALRVPRIAFHMNAEMHEEHILVCVEGTRAELGEFHGPDRTFGEAWHSACWASSGPNIFNHQMR